MKIYKLDQRCQEFLVQFRKTRNHLMEAAPNEGIKALLPKSESNILRIALVLHITNSLLSGRVPADYIPPETFEAAVLLGLFYLKQSIEVYEFNQSGEVIGIERRILDFANKKGKAGFTAREIRNLRALRKSFESSSQITEIFLNPMVEQGLLTQNGSHYFFAGECVSRVKVRQPLTHRTPTDITGIEGNFSGSVSLCQKSEDNLSNPSNEKEENYDQKIDTLTQKPHIPDSVRSSGCVNTDTLWHTDTPAIEQKSDFVLAAEKILDARPLVQQVWKGKPRQDAKDESSS